MNLISLFLVYGYYPTTGEDNSLLELVLVGQRNSSVFAGVLLGKYVY